MSMREHNNEGGWTGNMLAYSLLQNCWELVSMKYRNAINVFSQNNFLCSSLCH